MHCAIYDNNSKNKYGILSFPVVHRQFDIYNRISMVWMGNNWHREWSWNEQGITTGTGFYLV